jgi:hypothetical protein
MSLRENAGHPAFGGGRKWPVPYWLTAAHPGLFATHKIIDSGKKTAEITKM